MTATCFALLRSPSLRSTTRTTPPSLSAPMSEPSSLTPVPYSSKRPFQLSAFHIFKVFVANPNKPREVKIILLKNQEKLLDLLHNLSPGKGSEDEQF
ncbi:hypothetical protein JHK82_044963 [Glycine max]|uniref:Uncharacterized protein n=2 Tax=Glycine subgen. Soja TaxID=1462606 RepID=K7MH38_SOYBN|nr:hypothetical protein JHK86_045378 [Glycine max]KAG4941291.1 hypothetical protein JHK87_045162 [Glycine soja]KAG4952094.1 hypothetical protein JHK85_045961 [Glycine max]KAG5099911.1 hypothetical protein JHK82_044963 [Glycine max]KAG5108522.1 hypothetical protein JHK84_045429 [Glycine max]